MVTAQDKTKEDKEKQEEIQKTIDEQKKQMVEQKKAQEAAVEALEKAQMDLDKTMKNIDVEVEVNDPDVTGIPSPDHMKRITRSYRMREPFVVTPDIQMYDFHTFDSDNESTNWEFARKIKEKTLKSDYTFDVDKTSNSVVMSVMGDCKEGEIRIKIVMPSGKTYSDVVIDESGNLNWRKSFTISETENQDKAGAWKFIVSSNKATGYFKISLQAY
jgi:uncharacterized FlaG/YvyC family protein